MIKGIITPAVTALKKNRTIDYRKNKEHINFLIENGVDGILSLGTIGEFFNFTKEVKKEYITFAVDAVNKRVPLLIGTGGTVTEEVIELTHFAEKKGADGAVIVTPYYFQFDDRNLYRFYSEIAEKTDLPLYIYNFPERTGTNISADLTLKLAQEHTNIVGIKDTVDSIIHNRELITGVKEKLDQDFAVFSGYDEYLISNLLNGGNGVIGGLTNVIPGLFKNLYQAYYNNDLKRISELTQKLKILMNIYQVSSPFLPAIKEAVSILGSNINSTCKKPISDLNSKQKNKIESIIKKAEVK